MPVVLNNDVKVQNNVLPIEQVVQHPPSIVLQVWTCCVQGNEEAVISELFIVGLVN